MADALPTRSALVSRVLPFSCVDGPGNRLVLFLQGEVLRQSDGTHSAMTQFREMVFNPEYRAKELSKQQDAKLIEAQTCKSPS